jgi:hypothetical protein
MLKTAKQLVTAGAGQQVTIGVVDVVAAPAQRRDDRVEPLVELVNSHAELRENSSSSMPPAGAQNSTYCSTLRSNQSIAARLLLPDGRFSIMGELSFSGTRCCAGGLI